MFVIVVAVALAPLAVVAVTVVAVIVADRSGMMVTAVIFIGPFKVFVRFELGVMSVLYLVQRASPIVLVSPLLRTRSDGQYNRMRVKSHSHGSEVTASTVRLRASLSLCEGSGKPGRCG